MSLGIFSIMGMGGSCMCKFASARKSDLAGLYHTYSVSVSSPSTSTPVCMGLIKMIKNAWMLMLGSRLWGLLFTCSGRAMRGNAALRRVCGEAVSAGV